MNYIFNFIYMNFNLKKIVNIKLYLVHYQIFKFNCKDTTVHIQSIYKFLILIILGASKGSTVL